MTKPKVGRPETTIRNVYDSMEQCSAATGIPARALRLSKKSGCDAFKSNRIYLDRFIAWAFSPERVGVGDGIDWSRELMKAKTCRERIRLDQDRKLVISRADVGRRLCELASSQKEILNIALADNPELADSICRKMQTLVKTWTA